MVSFPVVSRLSASGIAHSAPMSPRPRAGRHHQCLRARRASRAEVGAGPRRRAARTAAGGSAKPRAAWVSWMRPTVPGPERRVDPLAQERQQHLQLRRMRARRPPASAARPPARARGASLHRARRSRRTPGRRSRARAPAAAPAAKPRRAAAVRICASISPPARTKPRARRARLVFRPAPCHCRSAMRFRSRRGRGYRPARGLSGERMQTTDGGWRMRCSPGTTGRRARCPGACRPAARRGARPLPGLALRGDAAADHGRGGARLLRGLRRPAGRRVADLAAAPDAEVMAAWAGLGYYARARNLLACARAVGGEHGGRFPDTEAGLRALPGVGPYTAAAIAAIAFDRRAVVRRRQRRAGDGAAPRGRGRRCRRRSRACARSPAGLTPAARARRLRAGGHGPRRHRSAPRARRPAASAPGRPPARGRGAGIAAELPRRAAKPAKPVRRGIAYLALRADGAVLVETRPRRACSAACSACPAATGPRTPPARARPSPADWRRPRRRGAPHLHPLPPAAAAARRAACPPASPRPSGAFHPRRGPAPALPDVMRKALRARARYPARRARIMSGQPPARAMLRTGRGHRRIQRAKPSGGCRREPGAR